MALETVDRQQKRHDNARYGYSRGAYSAEYVKPTVVVDLEGLEITPARGQDPLDRIVEIEQSEVVRTLRDMNRGRARLLAKGLRKDLGEALVCTDISMEELDGQVFNGSHITRINSPEDLEKFAKRSIILQDATQTVVTSADDPALSRVVSGIFITDYPVESNWFGKVIRLDPTTDGTRLMVSINGETSGLLDLASKRLTADIANTLERTKKSEVRTTIKTPDTSTGITTIDREAKYLDAHRRFVLESYEPPQGAIDEAILKVLLAHSERNVVVSKTDRERMQGQIAPFVKKGLPIPVSITFATGLRAPNPLKFETVENLPHYGWLHFADFMKTVNEKVRRRYEPGLRTIIFEEATIFGPLLGFSDEEVKDCLEASGRLFAAMGDPFERHFLTPDMFPADKVAKMPVNITDESRIYAIVCSRPEMNCVAAIDPLYTDRQNRSYAEIRRLVGQELWDDSKRLTEEMARHLDYRKKVNLFEQILDHPVAIDATVTDKDGRVVFDVTSPAMFNHGMPVVRRDSNGLHKVQIVPEYRIKRGDIAGKPVKIDRSELLDPKRGKGYMTFYYEQK